MEKEITVEELAKAYTVVYKAKDPDKIPEATRELFWRAQREGVNSSSAALRNMKAFCMVATPDELTKTRKTLLMTISGREIDPNPYLAIVEEALIEKGYLKEKSGK